jgi:D-inositol-3-phosphate glycosyltransferase
VFKSSRRLQTLIVAQGGWLLLISRPIFLVPDSNLSNMKNSVSPTTVALFTGGIDRHYACALGKALASAGVTLDVIGNAEMDSCGMRSFGNVRLLEFYAMPRQNQSLFRKLLACLAVYLRVIRYAASESPRTFHVLWNYKIQFFDRTFLLLYYKLLGKKIVFTAHNVNAAERDGVDSLLNRLTLRIQYRFTDHIFVHTDSMKKQLVHSFGIDPDKVTVIPFGVGDMVPQTELTSMEAKRKLGLSGSDRTILFFGRIVGYKGLDLLVDAFGRIASHDRSYRLIIAGEPIKESAQHWEDIHKVIESSSMREQVVQEIRYLADDEVETYLKAADVLILPYKQIYQSGVLFMSHNFGLPVIATDVGAFREDIIEGVNGYVCRSDDPEDLATKIEEYFLSNLYRNLDERRASIQNSVRGLHSWNAIAKATANVYARVSQNKPVKHGAVSGRFT